MRRHGRTAAGCSAALAVALVAGSGAVVAHAGPRAVSRAAPQGPGAVERTGAGGTPREVTLLTGDRVAVDGRGLVVTVTPGKGRERIPVRILRTGGRSLVIPADAGPLLAQGVLDRRLFDITTLLKDRYDDARTDSVPLIVGYRGAGAARARTALRAANARPGRALPAIDGEAVTVPKSRAAQTWKKLTSGSGSGSGDRARSAAPGIHRIWLNGRVRLAMDHSVPAIGAPVAWRAGYDGTGVKVAVLDSGVDQTHPDLAGREIAEANFSASPDAVDRNGHGTHVASTVAGSGTLSAGRYRGVAPGARILDGKVANDDGEGDESQVIAGMQWAVEQGADIVSMSLGLPDRPGTDAMEETVERLSRRSGALFVAAAGNLGGLGARTVESPGTAPAALSVGVVDRAGALADFSAHGPTADGALKPDLTAPGVEITAARTGAGGAPHGYAAGRGTSMSTPHVSGAAALLAQRHPTWSGQRIKQALTASAADRAGTTALRQGTGRVDAARAVTQTVVTDETSLSLGVRRWPHHDDTPLTGRLVYRNHGTAPVTLTTAVRGHGPDGTPAPEGMFTLGRSVITVPARGTASLKVTADTRRGGTDGVLTAVVVASGGGQRVRTAVSAEREPESYDVTFRHLDTGGRPAPAARTAVSAVPSLAMWPELADRDGDGRVTVRLRKGMYSVESAIDTRSGPRRGTALLLAPRFEVNRATTVVLDARRARPVRITAPGGARPAGAHVSHYLDTGGPFPHGSTWLTGTTDGLRTAHLGPRPAPGSFTAVIGGLWTRGADHYHLAHPRTGTFFTGLDATVDRADLARTDLAVGAPAPGRTAAVAALASYRDGPALGITSRPVTLPHALRQYVSTAPGLRWSRWIQQYGTTGGPRGTQLLGPVERYEAGTARRATANRGIFAPAVASAARDGDTLRWCAPMLTDSGGHASYPDGARSRTTLSTAGTTLRETGAGGCELGEEHRVGRLPAGPARYLLRQEVEQPPTVSRVSTAVVAEWSFVSGADERELPLSTVRITPRLTAASTARAGTRLTVPLRIDGPATRGGAASLTAEVSYDRGARWHPVPVAGQGSARRVALDHPAAAASVSLRTVLTDGRGSTQTLTVLDAYRLTR
ncbi:S8 family serine peptidase [Streptomyces yaizuensis]|uniref:S8 family peptidase n=1 Tax=Streptomyces yaizuensis TaxID=2989713 RepID=A0ABQ5NSI7_9ACTN|nr:S8 family serine peptidase [Streptomyces sp. YSPA8]GLF93346.1 S8 family peptidase [Streptomyces sp. YSPA8]